MGIRALDSAARAMSPARFTAWLSDADSRSSVVIMRTTRNDSLFQIVQFRKKFMLKKPKIRIKARKMGLPDYLETIDHGMTTTELAAVLGVSRSSIYDMAQAGRIPCYRVGTHVRFDPHIVAKWLRAR